MGSDSIVRGLYTTTDSNNVPTMNVFTVVTFVLTTIATASALQCYQCDGVKGQDLPCDGASGLGKKVECSDKCGLLLEERLTYNRAHSSVISSDYRWRRGCATDGHEMTDNSEAQPKTLTGELGCTNVGQRSED